MDHGIDLLESALDRVSIPNITDYQFNIGAKIRWSASLCAMHLGDEAVEDPNRVSAAE